MGNVYLMPPLLRFVFGSFANTKEGRFVTSELILLTSPSVFLELENFLINSYILITA